MLLLSQKHLCPRIKVIFSVKTLIAQAIVFLPSGIFIFFGANPTSSPEYFYFPYNDQLRVTNIFISLAKYNIASGIIIMPGGMSIIARKISRFFLGNALSRQQ
jgi:hypothetical protein